MKLVLFLALVSPQQRFDAGDPAGALSLLQQQQARRAADHYNRGLAAHGAGKTPEAILGYLRAQRLGGDEETLRFNLLLAKQDRGASVVDATPPWPMDLPPPLPQRLPLHWMAFLALFLAAFALRRRVLGLPSTRTACLALGLVVIAAAAHVALAGDRRAVATASQSLSVEPKDKAEELSRLTPGQIVWVEQRRDRWWQVSLPGGLTGWTPAAGLEALVEEEE